MSKGQLSFLPEPIAAARLSRLPDEPLATLPDARFEALLSVLRDGFFALGPELRVCAVNPCGLDLLGLTREETLGRRFIEVVPPIATSPAQKRLEASMRSRESTSIEWHLPLPDRWFEATCHPASDGGLWLLVRELTESKRAAAEQLRHVTKAERERDLLLAVLEACPVPMAVLPLTPSEGGPPVAGPLVLNEQSYATAGIARGTPLVVSDWEARDASGRLLGIDDWPITRVLRGDPTAVTERLYLRGPGQWTLTLDSSATPVHDRDGALIAVVGTFVDVSARDRDLAEREALLRQIDTERQKLATLLDRMPCGMLLAEPGTGRLLYMNRAGEALLGPPPLPSVGPEDYATWGARQPDGKAWPLEDLPPVRAARGVATAGDLLIRCADGRELVLRMSAAPVLEADGSGHVLAAFVDVTAEIHLAQERAREQEFYELFVGMLGHDLRTPLSAIVTSAELFERTGPMVPAQARAAERIRRSTTRMANMVSQVLDLTRSRFGGIPVTLRTVDLGDLCTRAVDECSVAHQGRAVDCKVDAPLEGAFDEERLLQLLGNLLDNAMKYGATDQPIRLRAWGEVDGISVEVHNHGRAIPPEELPTLFDPFHRGEGGRRANGQGLGLGLYIARQIAIAHRGDLRAHSDPRTGTTFTVWFPR
jgi:signal transduction histidine kinase